MNRSMEPSMSETNFTIGSSGENNVRNALVANRSFFQLLLTELNPTILKIDNVMN